MSNQSWRTDVDAGDYFLHQQKQLQVADRRPVVRKASDLGLGPGVAGNTVRLTDFNDLLATFNGFYSAVSGADNAPTSAEAFIGQVISDAEIGGRQVFTGVGTGIEYSRTFMRSPVDPEALAWSPWISAERLTPMAQGLSERMTNVLTGTASTLRAPTLATYGPEGYFERREDGISILKQGVYTGHIQVGVTVAGLVMTNITTYIPDNSITLGTVQTSVPMDATARIPFTVRATDGLQGFTVVVQHAAGFAVDCWWRFACTRVGDAV